MSSQARIRQALTVLEARRLELERVISEDLDRKFLAVSEPVAAAGTTTTAHSGGYTLESTPTQVAGFSSITWLA